MELGVVFQDSEDPPVPTATVLAKNNFRVFELQNAL